MYISIPRRNTVGVDEYLHLCPHYMQRSGQPRVKGRFTGGKIAFCTHRLWGWVHCRASMGILEQIEGKCLCRESNSIPVLSARSLVATLTTLSRLSDVVQY